MKSVVKPLCLLCVLCGASFCFSLDREAFSITNYDLNLQIEPEQHRLGVRGKITLRNDTPTPQKIAVLQISSSLNWRSIKAPDKPVQFVTQPYTSDIDHTGSLSEAIVTLPQEVAPHATIDLDIGYEGVILLDVTRLTHATTPITTPEEVAKSIDWDRIDQNFTGLRGVGKVAWYPIATQSADLFELEAFSEVLARWKSRESTSTMHLHIGVLREADGSPPHILINQPACHEQIDDTSGAHRPSVDCTYQPLGSVVPAFVIDSYGVIDRPSVTVFNLPSHAVAAQAYADAIDKAVPIVLEWFGSLREKVQRVDLPDDDAPFETGPFRFAPLTRPDSQSLGLSAVHQLTHAAFHSARPWIEEGLAHLAQALFVEQQNGRQAALQYITMHISSLRKREALTDASASDSGSGRSLASATDEDMFYRSKAMCVWWMLRDMVGDAALKKALAAYRPEEDKDPSYMQRLISAQTPRELEWFFDDWVYRDRGLPDFKVVSAFAAKTPTKSFMLTVTVENLGTAGAEVPVIIKLASGEVTKRLEVHAKDKATIRVELPAAPQQVIVNDGSVPESDTSNNSFKVDAPPS